MTMSYSEPPEADRRQTIQKILDEIKIEKDTLRTEALGIIRSISKLDTKEELLLAEYIRLQTAQSDPDWIYR